MKELKKLGIYSPYLDTLGGGERYLMGVAQVFADLGFQVEWWWPETAILPQLSKRFGIQLKRARVNQRAYLTQTKGNWWQKFKLHRQYDSLFFVTDGSIPLLLSKKNYIHMQVPFVMSKKPSLINRIKLAKASTIICNSSFTKSVIDATFSAKAEVLYPPVSLIPVLKKRNVILSVGRFDSPLHPKRHEVLIEAFQQLHLPDWQLALAGGCLNKNALKPLLKKANHSPKIDLIVNPSHQALVDLYGSARIYWHAAGYEVAPNEPYKAEHFGIAIVEAMSAGAVPLAYKMGGPLEIIDQAHNGYLWETTTQLAKLTRDLTYHQDKMSVMSDNARQKALLFSQEAFAETLKAIIS